MCIEITCYKETGKFYTSTIYEQQQDVPLHKEEFKQVVKDALAEVLAGNWSGYIVVRDIADSNGFHNHLFTAEEIYG